MHLKADMTVLQYYFSTCIFAA